jgi:hypothetical protein
MGTEIIGDTGYVREKQKRETRSIVTEQLKTKNDPEKR